MSIATLHGDAREMLRTLESASVQTIVTSPPYWRMRRYTDDPREIGQEPTPALYVAALVEVFEECRRVLRDDGTMWINLGDAYANDGKWGGSTGGKHAGGLHGQQGPGRARVTTGLPPKNLIGLPWRVAFALQDAGWVLRNEIIWWKRNAMPENVGDRCGRDHETVFLFSKSGAYYFDNAAIAAPAAHAGKIVKLGEKSFSRGQARGMGVRPSGNGTADTYTVPELRNPRTVWDIPTEALADEHYAPMPQVLAERCIKAGSRAGDTVLDPFAGSGTTARAALALQRRGVLIDLAYQELQAKRTNGVQVELFV